jgi:glutamate synthase (NADPH/NADH) small chain
MASKLNAERLETRFNDFKPALDPTEAFAEAQRCINCFGAPCISACPTGIDIPKFIRRIGSGHVKGAAKTILDSNIMGLSCAQSCPVEVLCEGACVYNDLDGKPISIGKLQRFAVEYAYAKDIEFYKPGKATGKRVALIGAGPASLACAHELRIAGHETVIFEKADVPGGLNTSGIAPYKMKADVSLREIERVLKMGVKIEYGMELGRNLKLDDLAREYDAVFLGLGLGPDSRLEAQGANSPRVMGAVDFIAKLKTAAPSELAWMAKVKAALVVGGGNTALDACRELKGLRIPRVVVSYRRGDAEMSGYKHEFKWAKQEGVEFWFHTQVSKFEEGTGGALKVTFASGPTLDADLVLLAIGQSKLETLLKGVAGLAFEKGKLVVDAKTGRTGHQKIWAGGDLANGGMEVVNAVAEGKRAAKAMNEVLHG